ncbi:MAG: hypothetical protein HQM10_19945 [Candidatus Riflebacteria bacterium]|nr:hypothetical protein [Candidatus Riflebacteria bacterium]
MRELVFLGMDNLFVVFFNLWFVLLFSIAGYGILLKTNKLEKKHETWFKKYFFCCVCGFILYAIVLSVLSKMFISQDFETAFSKSPQHIDFEFENKKTTVHEDTEIKRLKNIFDTAKSVSAHHSHPTDTIIFRVDGCSSSFILGKDSQNKSEFWLKVKNPEYGQGEFVLNHFRSIELEDWLNKL